MSTSETSKSKKGIRRLLGNRFSRSSSHLPAFSAQSEPITRASSPPEATHETGASIQTSTTLEIPPFNTEQPSLARSKAALTAIGGEHANTQPDQSPTSDKEITKLVWAGLHSSLQKLRDHSSVFPGLSVAAGILVECFDDLETATRNQQVYKDLAKELTTLSDTLTECIKGPTPPSMSKCVSSIERRVEIHWQVEQIKMKTERGTGGRLVMAKEDEQDTNLSMSTWSVANEHLVNTRLEALKPVKEATYDSELSSTVNRQRCTKGTRKKVISDLHNWLSNGDMLSVYWMNGMAGTGKTTIAYTFSEQLEDSDQLAASFFCTRASADCRKVTRIVPTIAYQLARYSIPFQSALYNILTKEPDAGSKNIGKQFERLLRDPLLKVNDTIPDNLVIVIDALDECEDRNGVETLLDILFRYANELGVRFFLTSRPEPEIYNRMMVDAKARAVLHLHDIETSLVQADIELYLIEELSFMSPAHSQIQQLAQRAGNLFIYAATLVRYVRYGKRFVDPHQRLNSALSLAPSSTKKHAEIDALYTAILQSALDETLMEQNEVEDVKSVLQTVLFVQEPIGVETIAALAGLDNPQRVYFALQPLRSVLHQSEDTKLVSTLHASFPDFMISSDRSKSFFCDIVNNSQQLAKRCLAVMKEQLQFNICKLESSFIPDDKANDLQERIKQRISSTLTYACRHWANHLTLASSSDQLLTVLEEFLSERLLFWMEVQNLRREMAIGVEGLLKLKQWLNAQARYTSSELVDLAEDACNLVTGFAGSPASQSTPHIYISLLPFCPQSSIIHKYYWKRTKMLLQLKGTLIERREGAALATWSIGSPVYSVGYSPDGNRVVAGCKDKVVRVLNAHGGTLIFDPLQGHTAYIESVTFSPDGKLVASGSYDNTLRVWNAYNGNPVATVFESHTSRVHSITFSPDSSKIFSGSVDGFIHTLDVHRGKTVLGPWASPSKTLCSAALSPDGTLVCLTQDSDVTIWNLPDLSSFASPLKGHTDIIRSIIFTPDGTRLVSGSDDHTIRVWNISDGSLVTSPFKGHTDHIYSVLVSPDGRRVASGSADCTVRVWNIDDGSLVAGPFFGHTYIIRSIAFSPDGTRIISGSDDETIRVWNVRDGLLVPSTPFYQHMSKLTSAWLSNSSTRIISSSADDTVWTWDLSPDGLDSAPLERRCPLPPCSPFASSNDRIAVFTHNHDVEILNANDGSFMIGPLHGHTRLPTSAGFSADSTHLVTGSRDRTVRIWNLKNSNLVAGPLYGHGRDVTSVSLSTDCSRVVSCSNRDRTIRVWNVRKTILNIASSLDASLSVSSEFDCGSVLEGANIQDDGWVTSSSGLLFWVPSDLSSIFAWPSPHTEFIITKLGILHIPEQELLLGDEWSRCYIPD